MNGRRAAPESIHSSPHYTVLSKKTQYCDAENHAKAWKLADEYGQLNERVRKIKRTLPDKEDHLERLKISFDLYKEFRIRTIKEIIRHSQNAPDPFCRLHRLTGRGLDILVLWPEVELAYEDLMAETQGEIRLTDVEKQKELEAIEQRKIEIKAEIDELLPSGYFLTRRGEIRENAYETHCEQWRRVQQFTIEPSNALGVHLDFCPAYEQRAHAVLGIGEIKRAGSALHAYIPENR